MRALNFLSAVSMAERIRRKELSPVELVESHLTQIEGLNPRLNAFVQIDAESAGGHGGGAGCSPGEPIAPSGSDHSGCDQYARTADGVGNGQPPLRSNQ